MKLAAIPKVERYALIGAPGWMCRIIDTLNPIFSDLDMRTFPIYQKSKPGLGWMPNRSAKLKIRQFSRKRSKQFIKYMNEQSYNDWGSHSRSF